jgi:hypothetical protein
VQSLGRLRGASQPETFVQLATGGEFLFQRIAPMMAGYSSDVARIASLGVINGHPVTANARGDVALFWPADELSLPPRERTNVVDQIISGLNPNRKELWI